MRELLTGPSALVGLGAMKRRAMLEINRPTRFGKTDLVHVISKKLNLVNYLELCTLSTNGILELLLFRGRLDDISFHRNGDL